MVLGHDRFVLLPDHKTVVISDLHLGKLTHFRKHGMALPSAPQMRDLDRLQSVFDSCLPERCIFLGDLFHSDLNSFWQEFINLLSSYPEIKFTLVKGNHDVIDEKEYTKVGIEVTEELLLNDLLFTHDKKENTEKFNIYGHIHPGILLKGKGRQSMRMPCFYFTENEAIMPAFGTFTGLYILDKAEYHRVFIVAGKEVLEL